MIVFFIPIRIKLSIIFIPLLVLCWLLSGDWKNSIEGIRNNRFSQLLIFFWFLHLFSVLYSINWQYGLLDVQEKLSFLVFPLFFITYSTSNRIKVINILKIFLLGCLVSSIVCITNAFHNSISFGASGLVFNPIPKEVWWENYFLYYRFSFLNHPSYLSMFFTFSIAILFLLIKNNQLTNKFTLLYVFTILYFTFMNYLLSSRVGLFATSVVEVIGFIWIFYRRVSILLKILVVSIIPIFLIVFIGMNKRINQIDKTNSNIYESRTSLNYYVSKVFDERMEIWRCIPPLVVEKPIFGYGVGDAKPALQKEYEKKGLIDNLKLKYNAHNQFLETLVGLGFIGLFSLLLLLVYPIFMVVRKKNNFIELMFLGILSINFLFESIFERVTGVIFFALFYSLFFCFKEID
ncbi:MAG: O-antigen ligase family protein [Bacteroidales bacterium]|nr:O-antigen ligase family protein [Bacteroidales bacterium]